MRNTINQHLAKFDLDVRKTNDARFVDQKCTPDIICFIADCILNIVDYTKPFTVKDIWDSPYFIKMPLPCLANLDQPIPPLIASMTSSSNSRFDYLPLPMFF